MQTTTSELTSFERLNPPVAWRGEEVDRLFYLRIQLGWSFDAIAIDMGRTESGVKSKFKYVINDRLIKSPAMPGVREPVPESVLAEQARRLVEQSSLSLTGAIFGDPVFSQSALAKKLSGAAA